MVLEAIEKRATFGGQVDLVPDILASLVAGLASVGAIWLALRVGVDGPLTPSTPVIVLLIVLNAAGLAVLGTLVASTASRSGTQTASSRKGIATILLLYIFAGLITTYAGHQLGTRLVPGLSPAHLLAVTPQAWLTKLLGAFSSIIIACFPLLWSYRTLRQRDRTEGIPLSRDGFMEAARANWARYRDEELFDPRADEWTPTPVEEGLPAQVRGTNLTFLLGESGSGKSSIAYRLGRERLQEDKPILWIGPSEIESSRKLEEAINKALRREERFRGNVGKDTLALASSGFHLHLVLDDLRKTEDPVQTVRKVQRWAQRLSPEDQNGQGGEDGPGERASVSLVCPVRRTVWTDLQRRAGSADFGQVVTIQGLSTEGATATISNLLDEADLDYPPGYPAEAAEAINAHPLLIGLLAGILDASEEPPSIAELQGSVIEKFVEDSIGQARVTRTQDLLPEQYREALRELGRFLLKEKTIRPDVNAALNGMTDAHAGAISALVEEGQTLRRRDGKIQFRHDRVREWVVADTLREELTAVERVLDEEDLFDPYFLDAHGLAVALEEADEEILQAVSAVRPEALFQTLRLYSHQELPGDLQNQLRAWVDDHGDDETIPALEYIAGRLLETRHTVVPDLAEPLPRWWSLQIARFQNGEVLAGLQEAARRGFRFWPPQFETAVEVVLEDHRDAVQAEVAEILQNGGANEETRRAAIILAAHLQLPPLGEAIPYAWQQAEDPEGLLGYALGALLRCEPENLAGLIEPLLDRWSQLPEEVEEDEVGRSPRLQVADTLRSGLRNAVSSGAVATFTDQAGEAGLGWESAIAVSWVDDPQAVEHVVRVNAERSREAENPLPPRMMMGPMGDRWQEKQRPNRHALSEESRERLESIWTNEDRGRFEREHAFHHWCGSVSEDELDKLLAIEPDSPMWRRALTERARIGDQDVVGPLLDALDDAFFHPHYLGNVWCEEAKEWVKERFGGGQEGEDSFSFTRTIRVIPAPDAEEILLENWEAIRTSSFYLPCALFVGTDQLQETVRQTVEEADDPEQLFQFFDDAYGIHTAHIQDLLTPDHLRRATPYTQYLKDIDLRLVGERAIEMGMEDWVRDEVSPHLAEEERQRLQPTFDEAVQEVEDRIEQEEHTGWVRHWGETFREERLTEFSLLNVFQEAAERTESRWGLEVLREALRWFGDREDLDRWDDLAVDVPDAVLQQARRRSVYQVKKERL